MKAERSSLRDQEMHNFDAQWYLNNYKDVELSGMDRISIIKK